MGGDREREGRHKPPRPGRLQAPRPGDTGAGPGFPVLFRRGDRGAPDYIRRTVLQAVPGCDRGPARAGAFPKGIYSSSFRIPGEGDRIPPLPGNHVPCGPEKRQVDPPRRDRLVYADRRL